MELEKTREKNCLMLVYLYEHNFELQNIAMKASLWLFLSQTLHFLRTSLLTLFLEKDVYERRLFVYESLAYDFAYHCNVYPLNQLRITLLLNVMCSQLF
jgi:hypothetical protein